MGHYERLPEPSIEETIASLQAEVKKQGSTVLGKSYPILMDLGGLPQLLGDFNFNNTDETTQEKALKAGEYFGALEHMRFHLGLDLHVPTDTKRLEDKKYPEDIEDNTTYRDIINEFNPIRQTISTVKTFIATHMGNIEQRGWNFFERKNINATQRIFTDSAMSFYVSAVPPVLIQELKARQALRFAKEADDAPRQVIEALLLRALKKYSGKVEDISISDTLQFGVAFKIDVSDIGTLPGQDSQSVNRGMELYNINPAAQIENLDRSPRLRAAYALFGAALACNATRSRGYDDMYSIVQNAASGMEKLVGNMAEIYHFNDLNVHNLGELILTVSAAQWALEEVVYVPPHIKNEIAAFYNNPKEFVDFMRGQQKFDTWWNDYLERKYPLSKEEFDEMVRAKREALNTTNPSHPLLDSSFALEKYVRQNWIWYLEMQEYEAWKVETETTNDVLGIEASRQRESEIRLQWRSDLKIQWKKDQQTQRRQAIERWVAWAEKTDPRSFTREGMAYFLEGVAGQIAQSITEAGVMRWYQESNPRWRAFTELLVGMHVPERARRGMIGINADGAKTTIYNAADIKKAEEDGFVVETEAYWFAHISQEYLQMVAKQGIEAATLAYFGITIDSINHQDWQKFKADLVDMRRALDITFGVNNIVS